MGRLVGMNSSPKYIRAMYGITEKSDCENCHFAEACEYKKQTEFCPYVTDADGYETEESDLFDEEQYFRDLDERARIYESIVRELEC